jgi:predicted  nucleic acid-binding Zn-ribbon protein
MKGKSMSSTTPERARLREAQIEFQNAEQIVEEARRALAHASAKWSACNSTVGELTRQLEDAEQDESASSSDRLIATLAGGIDCLDATSLVDELRKALDAAEIEVSVWRAARKTAEQAVESRLHALDTSRDRVNAAARRVADSELNIAAMIASAEAARQKTLSELSTLSLVAKMLPQASIGRQSVESFMAQGWCSPNSIERAPHDVRLSDWFDNLRIDASAVLKK